MKRQRRNLVRALPRREYLRFHIGLAVAIELVQAAIVAGLALSRADGHRLAAAEVAKMLGIGAFFAVCLSSVLTYFYSLTESLGGLVLHDGELQPAGGDPLAPASIWGRALRTGFVAGAWGTGLGVMVVAILNHRQAGFAIVYVGLVAAVGAASVVTSFLSRSDGTRAAFARPLGVVPRPARRRAWRDLALPLGLLLGLFNAGFAWVLFHDYTIGAQFGTHVLTEQQVLADTVVLVLLNSFGAAFICGRAGRAEAALGLVTFEDPATQVPGAKNGYGLQAIVYSVLAVILLTSLVRFLLPALPNLNEAMAARAFLAGSVTFLVGGFSYIRGAANVTAGAAPVVRVPASVTQ